jgi:6-phosphofructokinase 1
MSLKFSYEAEKVFGIRWGYKGFYTNNFEHWFELTPSSVSDIHKFGGTILGSSRGGFSGDEDGLKILKALKKRRINQVYIIGGDGTHRGIYKLTQLAIEQGINITFAGVPKTIDNDIPIIDQTFGFETACEAAKTMVQSAYIEATGVINGIGIVKCMGRHAGFIA